VLQRKILEGSGIATWMGERLNDLLRQADIVHDMRSLLRTEVLWTAQGRSDHDHIDALRYDPATVILSAICRLRASNKRIIAVHSPKARKLQDWSAHCAEKLPPRLSAAASQSDPPRSSKPLGAKTACHSAKFRQSFPQVACHLRNVQKDRI